MGAIVVNQELRNRLRAATTLINLKDEQGATLGTFVPETLAKDMLLEWAKAQISDVEIARCLAQPDGASLAQIWQRLGATA